MEQKKSNSPKIIRLAIYKPITSGSQVINQIVKNEAGEIQNENQTVKLVLGTKEFRNYLKQLPYSGYFKAEVVGYFPSSKSGEIELKGEDIPQDVRQTVSEVFSQPKNRVEIESSSTTSDAKWEERLQKLEQAHEKQIETMMANFKSQLKEATKSAPKRKKAV